MGDTLEQKNATREEFEEAMLAEETSLDRRVIEQAARVLVRVNELGLAVPIWPRNAAAWAAFMAEDSVKDVTPDVLEEGLPILVKTTADLSLVERELRREGSKLFEWGDD